MALNENMTVGEVARRTGRPVPERFGTDGANPRHLLRLTRSSTQAVHGGAARCGAEGRVEGEV